MKKLFIVSFLVQLFYVSSNCEVRLFSDVSQSQLGIFINHRFNSFEGFLDLNSTLIDFGFKPHFDSTISQRKLYSYYTHDEHGMLSFSVGLGFIRNKSKLKTGPVLFFRQDEFTVPYLVKNEYNSLILRTMYLGLGFVNKFNFRQKYVLENKCYINGSILNNTFFNYEADTTLKEFENSVTPSNIMTAGVKSCLLREFKFAGIGCGFSLEDYFRYYHHGEWDNYFYSKFFVELRLIFMKGYFREVKKELKRIFQHDNNSPEHVVETK